MKVIVNILLIFLLQSIATANTIVIVDFTKTDFLTLKKSLNNILKKDEKIYMIMFFHNRQLKKNVILSQKFNRMQELMDRNYAFQQENTTVDFNVPYLLYIAQKYVNIYKNINKIILINSIFYKDKEYDFLKGYPSDGFTNYENFKFLPKFKRKIKAVVYISERFGNDEKYFDGLRRFYYSWLKEKNIELIAFNKNFTFKEELFEYPALKHNTRVSIVTNLPKKITLQDDRYKFIQLSKNRVVFELQNSNRKNDILAVKFNGQNIEIPCNDKGLCKKEFALNYGENTMKFKTLNGKAVKKKLIGECKFDAAKDVCSIEKNILLCKNMDRKYGEKLNIQVNDHNDSVTVDRHHSFRIPIISNNDQTIIIEQKNCTQQIIKLAKVDIDKTQNEKTNIVQSDKQTIIKQQKNLKSLKKGKNTFEFNIIPPLKLSSFSFIEADGDYDTMHETIDIIVKTFDGNSFLIKANEPVSGDCGNSIQDDSDKSKKNFRNYIKNPQQCPCCKTHFIVLPKYLKNKKIQSIYIQASGDLNGIWGISDIKLYK